MEIHHGWELVDKERRAEQVYGAAGADIVARLAARASVHSAAHGVALKCGLLGRCNGADLLHVRSRGSATYLHCLSAFDKKVMKLIIWHHQPAPSSAFRGGGPYADAPAPAPNRLLCTPNAGASRSH